MRNLPVEIKELFNRLGISVKVERSDDTTAFVKALVQPLLYKNKLYVEMQPSDVGSIDDGCYLYLGPSDVKFSADDYIEFADRRYVVQRYEYVYLFSKPIYSWAIVRPCIVAKGETDNVTA